MASNPFHDLYLSEAISEDRLVELFSPVIVKHSGAVFDSGNVVIRGLQGTGKTMLLNLLRPEARIAYKRAREPFPVPARSARFIGAGVNLRKCGALEFAQHLERDMAQREVQELALVFSDFVNYWIVADLMATIVRFLSEADDDLLNDVGLRRSATALDDFANAFAHDQCWFGALDSVAKFDELRASVDDRISAYRRFLNLNVDELPESIRSTKTLVGAPILKCVEALKRTGVLADDAKVFVRVDQYEQLETLNVLGSDYGQYCQQLINKALAARDARVSYRIGTRTHSWDERPEIYRTNDVLELKRDYDIVDMDELFRRRENSRTWVFPEFAEDIFRRRMKVSEFVGRPGPEPTMVNILGKSLPPFARAHSYVPTEQGRIELIRRNLAALPQATSDEWINYVLALAPEDILAAWMSCAWLRQKSPGKTTVGRNPKSLGPPPEGGTLPWSTKPYWYKERVHHALMQIASANRQALVWSGVEDLMSLGGGQILVFLFLLQHVWDAWLRDQRGEPAEQLSFPIRHEVQTQGVREASIEWRHKQAEGSNAEKRRRFVDSLGEHFYVALTEDKAMSYPGANGFSLENSDVERAADVRRFLREAASFGDLYESPHTSKKKGERRTKYYLAPILSPFFRIPSVHTKEPEYVNISDVKKWLTQDQRATATRLSMSSAQPSLWDSAE